MSTAGQYRHEGQQRLLRLITLLAGHEIDGMAIVDIARNQSCSAALAVRDISNLVEAGYAEQVPQTGRYRLSPQIVQISVRHASALARAQDRLDEIRQRFSRG